MRAAHLDDHDWLHAAACINAVKSGETLENVVRRSQVTDNDLLRDLRSIAWGTAVKNGEPAAVVAARFGFSDTRLRIAKLIAVDEDINYSRETLGAALARYEVADEEDIAVLTDSALEAASDQLQIGGTVHDVAARYGLDHEEHLDVLTQLALDLASDTVRNGMSAQDAATRFGLYGEEHLAVLTEVEAGLIPPDGAQPRN